MCINYNIALALFGTLCIKAIEDASIQITIDMLLSDFDSQLCNGGYYSNIGVTNTTHMPHTLICKESVKILV